MTAKMSAYVGLKFVNLWLQIRYSQPENIYHARNFIAIRAMKRKNYSAKSNAIAVYKNPLAKRGDFCKPGADYEARTRYLHLGKVALYQMS